MKTQLYGAKSGFTLFELMIVIAIFGSFVLATNIFNYSPQTESERADRMMAAVSGKLKTELQNMSMWRMPKRDGKIAQLIQIEIGTGGLTYTYMTGTSIATQIFSWSFRRPFFEWDTKYEIKSVIWTGSNTVVNGFTGTGQLIIEPTNMTFTGVGISGSGYTLLEIKIGYNTRTRKVILDRRSGKVIETKLY